MIKRAKASRARGNKTHGWGHKKKHRGKGSRGGKGNAGSGKRGDSKKPSFWKNTKYAGSHGFSSKRKQQIMITVKELDKKFEAGKINLTEKGYDKLVGTGKTNKKFEITISKATPKAEEKIKKAGGKITSQEPKEAAKSQDSQKQTTESTKSDKNNAASEAPKEKKE